MRDKDTRMLQEKYESLYAGKIEEDEDTSLGASDDKEDKDEDTHKDSDKEEKKEKESDKDEPSKDSSDEDKEEHEESESDEDEESESDEDSDEDGEKGEKSEGDSGIQSKVKQLQKQYNDLLVDAFEKYAAECIENALDGVKSSFGEDITGILDNALQELKGKILTDLGIEDSIAPAGMGMGMGGGMGDGGMEMEIGGEPEVKFGSNVGGIPTMSKDEDEESDEDSDEVEEESCGMKHKKMKIKDAKKKLEKPVTESAKVANFYGFV